jgi:hypothetical protein
MKKSMKKRFAIERETVRMLVVELSHAQLRQLHGGSDPGGAGGASDNVEISTATTQQLPHIA